MFNRKDYPPEWPAIRQAILARAQQRCEGTPEYPDCRAANHEPHPETGSKVVLTIAHMGDMNPLACEESNLRALCQRCHLSWDRPHHRAVQKQNRTAKKRQIQPVLEMEES